MLVTVRVHVPQLQANKSFWKQPVRPARLELWGCFCPWCGPSYEPRPGDEDGCVILPAPYGDRRRLVRSVAARLRSRSGPPG